MIGQSSSGRRILVASSSLSKLDFRSLYVVRINSHNVVNHSTDGTLFWLGCHVTCLSEANHLDGKICIKKGSIDAVSKRLKTPDFKVSLVENVENSGTNSLLTKSSGWEGSNFEYGVRKTGFFESNFLIIPSSVNRRGSPFICWRKFSSSIQNCKRRLR